MRIESWRRAVPSLLELQTAFIGELMQTGSTTIEQEAARSEFSGQELMRVYRNNLFISLRDALGAVYPVVAKLVGDGFFAYMGHEFIKRHPSRSGNLHDFGAELSDYLKTFEPAATLPYLTDVARLEWARHEAYYAASAPAPDLSELGRVPREAYDQIRFELHPSAGLIASPYPVLQIWEAHQEESKVDASSVSLASGGERVLVLRPRAEIVMKRSSVGEHELLSRFMEGLPLCEAVGAALDVEPEFDLESTLRQHLLLGTVVGFAV